MQKLTGSYYTPKALSDFMVRYVMNKIESRSISILEPSVGDGVFITSLTNNLITKKSDTAITILDINKAELLKAKKKVKDSDSFSQSHIINKDFLEFQKEINKRYSLIIGNPPYINIRLLSYENIKLCEEIHARSELSKKRINNIWTAFVAANIKLLTTDGVLAFVLPADLLQVKYAEEIRTLLENSFNRIEIFTFKTLAFPEIEQQTVILFAFKKAKSKGTFFYSILDVAKDKFKKISSNGLMISPSKWTHYILNTNEIKLLNYINSKLPRISDFVNVSAGIVTGANSYFILSKKTVDEYDFTNIVLPIIPKSKMIDGSIDLSKKDFEKIVKSEKPTFLLALDNTIKRNGKLSTYIKKGVKLKINQRYKCSLRNKWYCVPNISTQPEAIFFKRIHLYPKVVRNTSNVYVTDAAYKIFTKKECNIESFIFSFYNIVTLIFSELMGRKYGGGVLELTPNEFKNLPLPYMQIGKREYNKFKKEFKSMNSISDIFCLDQELFLSPDISIDTNQQSVLLDIYSKLVSNRIKVVK